MADLLVKLSGLKPSPRQPPDGEAVRCAFATYDATARGFFGPTGVTEEARHKGIGRALLNATLQDMASQGYAYGIIGATTSLEFYRKEVGAIEIPSSAPGFYQGLLKRK